MAHHFEDICLILRTGETFLSGLLRAERYCCLSQQTLRARFTFLSASEYPAQRSKKDSEGAEMGVAGSVSLLQNVTLSTQPISSLDWSPDKKGLCVCGAFDQTVRVLIVTKLNKV